MRLRGKGVIFPVLLAAMLFLGGCAQSGGESEEGVLRVGVRDDIMNFSYLNETTGKYYGMEIDLAEKIAEDLGYSEVEYTTVTPDTRSDMLENGEVDCIIATYSIAETRLEKFDFTEAYYKDSTVLMVADSTMLTEPEQLKGKTVGILNGTNAGPLLAVKLYELGFDVEEPLENNEVRTVYKDLTVVKTNSYTDLNKALEEGTVDAACMDGCVARGFQQNDNSILNLSIAEQDYGVATQKGSELSKPMAEEIEKLLSDGTIDELIDKWD